MAAVWRQLVEGRWAQKLVRAFAMPADRKAQERLDVQRAYLYSLLYRVLPANAASAAGSTQAPGASSRNVNYHMIQLKSKEGTNAEHRKYVAKHLRQQLLAMARAAHEETLKAGDAAAAAGQLTAAAAAAAAAATQQAGEATPMRLPSLLKALGQRGMAQRQEDKGSSSSSSGTVMFESVAAPAPASASAHHGSGRGANPGPVTMSREALADACRNRLGFRLRVAPSQVPHVDAGQGLFLEGEARVGTVVALVPGIVYARTQYQHMPNFPQIDCGNSYLSCTYDMSIVDSLPWGRGDTGGAAPGVPWAVINGPAAEGLHLLEGRHPWALGHYINHPPKGGVPNVLELGFTLELTEKDEPWLRAYLPLLPFQVEPVKAEDLVPPCTVSGLVLMATRQISDGQELLLNYRMSPHVPRPAWYHSHSPEEEAKRWAKISYIDYTNMNWRSIRW